ncbi:MAG: oxidative damage protection protein [bacterium]|nr:oxidative damage protection protein [bacterium]
MAGDEARTVRCARCNRDAPAATGVFYGGELGEQIKSRVCADCWVEWQEAEVMVINELRLNFMDPESQEILARHMQEFLMLDGESGAGGTGSGPIGPGMADAASGD